MTPPRTVLLLGCGDVARRIGARCGARGDRVIGLARSAANLAAAAALCIEPLACDFDALAGAGSPGTDAAPLPASDLAFYCAPPREPTPAEADAARGTHVEPRLRALLQRLPPPRSGLLYLSTTGVYGDCHGRWVDEREPLKPGTPRARRRLAAEHTLRAWAAATGARALTLRVPGIYGPGRLPVARLRAGTPLPFAHEAPHSNRIHADDLADAALLVLERGEPGAAYHVADGTPTTMTDYFLRAAALLGLPAPPLLPLAEARAAMPSALASYFEEDRRLDTRRLRALGFVPRYPTLVEGLSDSLG